MDLQYYDMLGGAGASILGALNARDDEEDDRRYGRTPRSSSFSRVMDTMLRANVARAVGPIYGRGTGRETDVLGASVDSLSASGAVSLLSRKILDQYEALSKTISDVPPAPPTKTSFRRRPFVATPRRTR